MTRVAAIDCGTNSVRLLVADVDVTSGRLVDLQRRLEITRLGQGVDRTGRLRPEALSRTLAVLSDYAETIRGLGASAVRAVATSATREARNRHEFVGAVRELLGVEPEVLSGAEEAELTFTGAVRELTGMPELAAPYLVVDIGGGSTEYVLGSNHVISAISVDMGCVRLTERYFHDDPPMPEQVEAAVEEIDDVLSSVATDVPLDQARTLVGVAGTVTTIAGIALDLKEYDPAEIHLSRIPVDEVHDVSGRLLWLNHAQRAAIPVMHPGRVDVIAAGSLILSRTLRKLGLPEVVASEHDILDGVAWSLAG